MFGDTAVKTLTVDHISLLFVSTMGRGLSTVLQVKTKLFSLNVTLSSLS